MKSTEPVSLLGPNSQFFAQLFNRQTDDVAERPGDFGYDSFAAFLDGVGASLVERVDFFYVIANLLFCERMKKDISADSKNPLTMVAQVHQTDTGHDLMCAAFKSCQHLFGFFHISWL